MLHANGSALAYSPDASQLAVVSEDGCLRLVDVAEEKYVTPLTEHPPY